jgi:hypothetical protein
MAGLSDGVSKLWILRAGSGLNIQGHKDDLEAIDALIRHALVFGPADMKRRIEKTAANALKHLEDETRKGPESE